MDESKLLYEKIISYLRQEIKHQNLKPGDKLPTEMELAEQFGVSRITSKRALADLTAEGIIYRVRGSGSFVANPSSTDVNTVAGNKADYSRIVSFVLPFDINNGGIMNVVAGASRIMAEKGYILSVHCCNADTNEEKEALQQFYERKAAGIILYPISDRKNLEVLNLLYLNNYPIVTIDKYYESLPISNVVSDNFAGAYEAVNYLIRLGHKKIAMVSDNKIEDATSIRNRYFGYCKALNENKIPIEERLVKMGFMDAGGDYDQVCREILKELLDFGITGICGINDYVARSLLKGASDLGISVPGKLSIIGFDNLDFSQYLSVPLTTVQQDFYRIGEEAAKLLLASIETGEHKCFKSVIPIRLIERESCGAANY